MSVQSRQNGVPKQAALLGARRDRAGRSSALPATSSAVTMSVEGQTPNIVDEPGQNAAL
jgi:hypothetical protein